MTEERLQEIKDSIDFQALYMKEHNFETTLLEEETELYNEVIKLKKFEKYTKEDMEEIISEEISSYVNENERLKKELNKHIKEGIEKDIRMNECADEILKELNENHHLSYGVALSIRQKLIDYKELKGDSSNE